MKIRHNKSGVVENYSAKKLISAIDKSFYRARGRYMTFEEAEDITSKVEFRLYELEKEEISTAEVHSIVEQTLLRDPLYKDVGECYFNYRSLAKRAFEKRESNIRYLNGLANAGNYDNANSDSTLASTLASLSSDLMETDRIEDTFLTVEEQQARTDGYIYIHDLSKRMNYSLNCCLFLLGNVLKNGCEMNGIWYTQPKSLRTAFSMAQDIILICASQQYGGFTVPRIDEILAEYAEMSEKKYLEEYLSLGIEKERAQNLVETKIYKEFEQGFQGMEYKLNTVASSRGDYPFTTFTAGLGTSKYAKMAAIAMFNVRKNGQGKEGHKKPVLFPKLVFLYDEKLHSKGCPNDDVFAAGVACSMKACYPDWLSLTGEGYIASMYKKYGKAGVISPMGCRAFLSPYYERGGFEPADENDKPVYEGRWNLGAVSLNLPMILAKAKKEGRDFYEVLDYYMELIRNFHKRTRDYIGNMPASRNPIAFCYGGLYGGNLKPTEKIAPILEPCAYSFGVTALNELNRLYNGKSIREDGSFPLEVMEYINEKLKEYKEEDHMLYAVYGTPAESLCGKQVQQFREKYGIINGVSDREYVSNSFHCHVTENMSPVEKQDKEKRFWEFFNGGKIQYIRFNIGYNEEAVISLILRAMEFGFYFGINLSLNFCDDCGYMQVDLKDICPKCGGIHITTIDRMNGYLGFTRVGKFTEEIIDEKDPSVKRLVYKGRFNAAKKAEIAERVSM